jgi:hypothetical protein
MHDIAYGLAAALRLPVTSLGICQSQHPCSQDTGCLKLPQVRTRQAEALSNEDINKIKCDHCQLQESVQ